MKTLYLECKMGASGNMLLGALLAMLPGFARSAQRGGEMLLRLSLFTAVLNVAAAMV